jgi:tetratricopeptide (TPR) repeat protein/O-antigen ligase
MIGEGRVEWRRSAADVPLALLTALVIGQLALGNRPLTAWALAPAPSSPEIAVPPPSLFLASGTVAPGHTSRSLAIMLTYAGVYVLVVNVVRTRRQLHRLVTALVSFGSVLAFAALLDYLGGEAWLLRWRDRPLEGRLAGTFGNPDHFATWLSMVVCLGLGLLLAHESRGSRFLSRETREEAARRFLPFVGIVVTTLALVFTLSRAGMLSLLVTFVVLLFLLGHLGHIRWSLAMVGALVVIAFGYAAWIGLEPLLVRVRHVDHANRWVLAITTLPILKSFPFFGVGLGAFGAIYGRYQPAALEPGKLDIGYAHNDLLQLIVELGVIGAIVVALFAWRVTKDLLGAHLLGRAACPVGGGEEEGARRRDPFALGIAIGALGGVVALLVHALFDFSGHIPANGVLGAACLGIATVALHTRFSERGPRLLTAIAGQPVSQRHVQRVASGVAVVLFVAVAAWIVRAPVVDTIVAGARGPAVDRATALRRLDRAVAVDPGDERARAARGRLRLEAALDAWNVGVAPRRPLLQSWDERRSVAVPLVRGAVEDLRTALSRTPLDPFLHETSARAYWLLAVIGVDDAPRYRVEAVGAFGRAIASAPESPFAYRSLAVFAVPQGDRFREVGLQAARRAVERDPALLPDLVDRFLPLRLTTAEWIAMVRDSPAHAIELGFLLEQRRLLPAAADVYGHAGVTGSGPMRVVPIWLRGRLLLRQGRLREALADLDRAVAQDTSNPELHLDRARILAALGAPEALDAYRLVVSNAEVHARASAGGRQPFGPLPPRVRAVVAEAVGGQDLAPGRYRRHLAQYLNDRNRWHEALVEWEMVLAENPSDATAVFGRAVALDAVGAHDQAVEAYRRAVALDGDNVAFRLRLARRLWETDQYYQAINEWRTVLGRAPGNIEARLALARAYVRVGSRAEAVTEYRQLLRIVPDSVQLPADLAHLGRDGTEAKEGRPGRK